MRFAQYQKVKIVSTAEIGVYIGIAMIPYEAYTNITNENSEKMTVYPHMVDIADEIRFIFDGNLEKVEENEN